MTFEMQRTSTGNTWVVDTTVGRIYPRASGLRGRPAGSLLPYKSIIADVLIEVMHRAVAELEIDLRGIYPWLLTPWQVIDETAYPQVRTLIQNADAILPYVEYDTRPHMPPWSGPTPRHPERPQTRLWRWMQRLIGNTAYAPSPVSAWPVAVKIANEGTQGKRELQRLWDAVTRRWQTEIPRRVTEQIETREFFGV